MSAGEVRFETSGHTGPAVAWWRTADQLRTEVELVQRIAIGPVERVVSFAPPQHLYGHLYGEVLPRLRGIEIHQAWREDPTTPPSLPLAPTLLVCLPATWTLLQHILPTLAGLPRLVALHSSAPVTPAAGRVEAALRGDRFRAVELLGSTETGAVAHREIDAASPRRWRLLPDVRLMPEGQGGEQILHVASPRIARPEGQSGPPASWRLPDVIRPCGGGEFEHVGRASRLVKVNGRRVHLDQVESAVEGAEPGLEVACVPVGDLVRGEAYELYYSGRYSAAPAPQALRTRLERVLHGLPAPRAVHPVRRIPRGLTGKVQLAALRAEAG